jgi:hypothetical protein
MRTAGFSLNINDPQTRIERSFDFVGERPVKYYNSNKYFINVVETVPSGISNADWTKVLNNPIPAVNPDTTRYILRVYKIRSGVFSEVEFGTGSGQYEYNSGTNTLTVHNADSADVYKIQYTAATYITGQQPFVKNDSDMVGVQPFYVSLYIGSGNYLHKIQSATVDVRFDRTDYYEVGSQDVVQRGVANKTVTLTLNKFLDEDNTLEEVLRGVSAGYGVIDPYKYSEAINFVCKIYSDETKQTFKWGFKIENLSPTEVANPTSVGNQTGDNVTLESSQMVMSDTEGDLA